MGRKKKEIRLKEPVRIREKKIAGGNISLYLDIYQKGLRKKETLKLYLVPEINAATKLQNANTRKLAEQIKAQRILDIQREGLVDWDKVKKSRMTLTKWMDDFVKYNAELSESSMKTKRNTHARIDQYLLYIGKPEFLLKDVDKEFCKGFITFLKTCTYNDGKKQLSTTTCRMFVNYFGSSLAKAVRDGLIEQNPFLLLEAKEKPQKRVAEREFLTIEEIKKVMNTPCRYELVKKAFLFSCFTGLRYSDMKALNWSEIHKAADGKTEYIDHIQVKTKDRVTIPLSEETKKIDTEKALDKVKSRTKVRNLSWWGWTQRIAAILSVPLLIGVLALYPDRQQPVVTAQMVEIKTNAGMTTSVLLPDSTVVHLNSESSLRYPTFFAGDVRQVELNGEAYFDVTQHPRKRFIVSTPHHSQVEVYGTSFNVEAYGNETPISTTLIEGSVGFIYKNSKGKFQKSMLSPRQKLVYSPQTGDIKCYATSGESEISWKDGKLIFNDTPLDEVLHMLGKRFNVEFVLSNKGLKGFFIHIHPAFAAVLGVVDAAGILFNPGALDYRIQEALPVHPAHAPGNGAVVGYGFSQLIAHHAVAVLVIVAVGEGYGAVDVVLGVCALRLVDGASRCVVVLRTVVLVADGEHEMREHGEFDESEPPVLLVLFRMQVLCFGAECELAVDVPLTLGNGDVGLDHSAFAFHHGLVVLLVQILEVEFEVLGDFLVSLFYAYYYCYCEIR